VEKPDLSVFDSQLKRSTVLVAPLTHVGLLKKLLILSRMWYWKLEDRVTIKYIAQCLKLSSAATHHITADGLGYNKVCARWVPRMLTVKIMRVWTQTSNHNLELYRADPDKFWYVTMDETWAHHFDPEMKQESMQWKHPTSPPVVKFRKVISASKVMVSVFWES